MAKRDVQLDIKVNGTDQIAGVNNELAQTSVNAEKVADSALKLTKGIAGGFELAAQAAGVFGEETGAAFEKTVQRATEYIALSNALKDVAEGFSKENIKGLTAIFQGFTKAGIGAKLFGSVTASAITATGIGALVVALGLLVANWDAVTEAVGGFIDSIPFLKSIKDTVNELIDKVGSLGNLFKAVGAFISAAFTAGADASDAFNKSLEDSKAADALDETLKAQEKINKELDRSIELLKAQGGEEQKIFDLRRANLNENIRLLDQKNNKTDEEIDKLEDYRQKLKLLDIEEKKFRTGQIKAANEVAAKRKEESDKIAEDARKANEQRIKDEQDAQNNISQLRINAIQDTQEREIKQLYKDYDDKIKALKGSEEQITEQTLLLIAERERKASEYIEKYRAQKDKELSDIRIKNVENEFKKLDNFLIGFKGIGINEIISYDGVDIKKLDIIFNQLEKIRDSVVELGDEDAFIKFSAQYRDLYNEFIKYNKLVDRTISERFGIFREDNKELFEQISAYAGLAGELIDSLFSRQSFLIQQNLNQIAEDTERVNNQYTEAVNNREALEDELATAQGARREEILNSLDRERNKEKQLAAEREKLRKAEIDQKNKQAKIEYANAVIQSTIAAAQAVLAALATVPPASFAFAAVAAAISAIQTGIVIANKPKPLTYAQGGFTQGLGHVDSTGHEVAGVVHANEYVVPAKVLNSESGYRMVAALEAMRQGKPAFADGGLTTPTITGTETSSGTEALMAALQGLNLTVGVTEINTVQNRVQVIEQRASI